MPTTEELLGIPSQTELQALVMDIVTNVDDAEALATGLEDDFAQYGDLILREDVFSKGRRLDFAVSGVGPDGEERLLFEVENLRAGQPGGVGLLDDPVFFKGRRMALILGDDAGRVAGGITASGAIVDASGTVLISEEVLGDRLDTSGGGGGAAVSSGGRLVDVLTKRPDPILTGADFATDHFFWPAAWAKGVDDGAPGEVRLLISSDHADPGDPGGGVYLYTAEDPYSAFTERVRLIGTDVAGQVETPQYAYMPGDPAGKPYYVYCHSPEFGNLQSTRLFRFATLDPATAVSTREELSNVIDIPQTGEFRGKGHTGYLSITRREGLLIGRHPVSGGGTVGSAISYSYDGIRWQLDPTRLFDKQAAWPDATAGAEGARDYGSAGGSQPIFTWHGRDYLLGQKRYAGSRLGGSLNTAARLVVGQMDPASLQWATPPEQWVQITQDWEQEQDFKTGCAFLWQGRVHLLYVTTNEERGATTPLCHLGLIYESA